MKSRALLLPLSLIALTFPSCLYTNVIIPLDTDVATTKIGTKVGESESQSILGLFAWGDAGTKAAAEKGNMTVINHLDRHVFAILGFVYVRTTTIAYGD